MELPAVTKVSVGNKYIHSVLTKVIFAQTARLEN